MAERVVVTGTGIISALGSGKDAHLNRICNLESGLHYARHLKTRHASEFVLGEVDHSNDELSAMQGIPSGDNGYTRTALLSLAAMQNLAGDSLIPLLKSAPFAFINANTVGGMSKMENIYMDVIAPETREENVKYIETLDCAESTERVASFYGLRPFMATISTACSSSSNALIMGARMIRQGIVKRAVCGGCDALSRFTLNGFFSLKNVDRHPARPFDQNRMGLNIGEGAGYCLLESESAARERGAPILAVLSGYANTNDAYHPTAPSPQGDGASNTMMQAMQLAGIQAGQVGYINAHGTATLNNDLAEGMAIQRVFGRGAPPFSSTKPYTGHTLAAAGVIEAIFSIWALEEKLVYPNLNFSTRMEELEITPATALLRNAGLDHVLSNSFGFGGSNVSLIFSKA